MSLLLSLDLRASEKGNFYISTTLAGNHAIKMRVEAIKANLKDVTLLQKRYQTKLKSIMKNAKHLRLRV